MPERIMVALPCLIVLLKQIKVALGMIEMQEMDNKSKLHCYRLIIEAVQV
jgi:hypothetical protein